MAAGRKLVAVLLKGIDTLKAQGAEFCLVGGLARAFHATSRTTRDIDFAVSTKAEAEVDRVIFGMQGAGFRLRQVFQRDDGALATARLTDGDSPIRLDLLFATSGIERLVVETAVEREIASGVTAPVIRRPHLIAMKLVAARPHDVDDIHVLLDSAADRERDQVAPVLAHLPDRNRANAQRLWKAILKDRARRKNDLRPDPARLAALTRRK